MKIGTLEQGFNAEKIRALLSVGRLTEPECMTCWALRLCDQCAAAADAMTELSADKKRSYCRASREKAEEALKDIVTVAAVKRLEARQNHGEEARGRIPL